MSIQEQYKARNYQDGRVRVEHVGARMYPRAEFDPYFYGVVNDKDVATYVYLFPPSLVALAIAGGGRIS